MDTHDTNNTRDDWERFTFNSEVKSVRSSKKPRHAESLALPNYHRLLENAKFIEQGHLDDLILRTKESLKPILD
jgi:hypothetical protein